MTPSPTTEHRKGNNEQRVTTAWHSIHARHPDIHAITSPRLIGRMKRRDFLRSEVIRDLPPGSRIAEAGCGSGRDSLYFSFLGHRCTAIDINERPLELLRSARDSVAVTSGGEPLQLETILADIFRIPVADHSFDVVFNSGVIEHYDAQTRRRLLAELSRVTRPGGYVAVIFPNKRHLLDSLWTWLTGRLTDIREFDIPEQDLGEVFPGDAGAAGLDMVLIDQIDCYDTISHYPGWYPLRVISYAATAFFPRPPAFLRQRLGTRVLVIMRKPSTPSDPPRNGVSS